MNEPNESAARLRAKAYDEHYHSAGWKSVAWTREKIEAFLTYALEAERGGHINGNEIAFALRQVGVPNLEGKTILDYCCGTGITAIYFALLGADVEAFDASRIGIDIARESAERSGVAERVEFRVADARALPYAANTFDAAFCQSALHIVADYPECSTELARVLKPGTKAVFCEEALGHNPLLAPIRCVRRRARRECGGRPLKYADIEAFGKCFSATMIHHFNLLAQSKMLFAGQLRRTGRLRPSTCKLVQRLERIDERILQAAPWLERLCGKVVTEFIK